MNGHIEISDDCSYKAILIGVSAGGFKALKQILPHLSSSHLPAVVIVVHRIRDADDYLETAMNGICALDVKQAEGGEKMKPGHVYFAPPNYHLLIEDDLTFSLSVEMPVNYARPSVDATFETAAEALGPALVGVVLTGANDDGSRGLKEIKAAGGLTVVQDPQTAAVDAMPRAAISAAAPDYILSLDRIGPFLTQLRTEEAYE